MTSQEKVLIVEDEPHALSGLAELVSGWGYRTETARDGIEALEKVTAWQPGIIVSDLKMPRMDGLELLARLGETHEKVAVIMLTAQGSIAAAVEAMKNGAYDFIQKPVDPTRLRATLTNAARQREQVPTDAEEPPHLLGDLPLKVVAERLANCSDPLIAAWAKKIREGERAASADQEQEDSTTPKHH